MDFGRIGLIWGEARVFADHPDKPFDGSVGADLQQTSVTYNVLETIREAKSEVLISSPYFVPGARGMAFNARVVELIKFLDMGTRVASALR